MLGGAKGGKKGMPDLSKLLGGMDIQKMMKGSLQNLYGPFKNTK